VQNKNPTRFYCKNKVIIEQGCDNKNVPKIGVEHIEINVRFYFYLYSLGI
jgi:hypothetical protein